MFTPHQTKPGGEFSPKSKSAIHSLASQISHKVRESYEAFRKCLHRQAAAYGECFLCHEQPHLSVQRGLLHVQFACLFVDCEHVTCSFWLLTDDAVGDLGINRPSLVVIFPLDLHHKGSCSGSQQDKTISEESIKSVFMRNTYPTCV